MKKENECRYIVTDVVSIGVNRLAKKGEAYRMATGAGWGLVDWWGERTETDWNGNPKTVWKPVNRDREDKTQALYCDEDSSGVLYLNDGKEFCIFPGEEFFPKDFPVQADIRAMIFSDSCGRSFWAKDITDIKIFVIYDKNGLIEDYRLDNWTGKPYDGETEIAFKDLQSEEEYEKTDRADITGTLEYYRKMEAAA